MFQSCSALRSRWIPAVSPVLIVLPLLMWTQLAQAQDLSRTFLKGPYLQAPGATTMTILWESPTNRPGTVYYGRGDYLGRSLRLERPDPLLAVTNFSVTNLTAEAKTNVTTVSVTNVVFLYELTLTNLQPNTVYSYAAETDGAETPPRHFKTFGAHPSRVRFIAYGDTRTNPKTHAALAANFKQYSPEFILHLGDLVAEGKRYDLWGKEFFGPLARVIDEVPILPAIGNHEQDGTNYLRYVHLPGAERWYSYDVGPVHILSLDYHFEKATDDQFLFARQDLLKSDAPWKIVILHYPVFNIGGHGTRWGQTNYLPLFHEARVDLVIGGHSHLYERFKPIAARKGQGTWPITYITTGGGGAPLAMTYPHPALAARAATNHFLLVEATPTSLQGFVIATNNTVLDSFQMRKLSGQPPHSYFSQVYSEEALQLSFDAGASLAGAAAAVPTTNTFTPVRLSIPPLVQKKLPVQFEISLAPGSAPYYELEGAPVRVLSPARGESNRVAWVRVKATGKKKVTAEGKDKDLSPALVFQARLTAGKFESRAYGQNCRVKEIPATEVQASAVR